MVSVVEGLSRDGGHSVAMLPEDTVVGELPGVGDLGHEMGSFFFDCAEFFSLFSP